MDKLKFPHSSTMTTAPNHGSRIVTVEIETLVTAEGHIEEALREHLAVLAYEEKIRAAVPEQMRIIVARKQVIVTTLTIEEFS